MIKTYLNKLLLPVNPFDDITFKTKANNKQYEILDLGDVTVIGARKLRDISIKSLFTDNEYPFCTAAPALPAKEYVDEINGWMDEKKPVRFIVAGDGVDINLLCSIESFDPSIHFGETNEYYYSLALKEYRQPQVMRISVTQSIPRAAAAAAAQPVRPPPPPAAKTYTVKSGDCLSGIAKQFYGSASQYPKIVSANKDKIKNPNMIYPGWVLTIP